jgi:hypothetical protein
MIVGAFTVLPYMATFLEFVTVLQGGQDWAEGWARLGDASVKSSAVVRTIAHVPFDRARAGRRLHPQR